MRSWQPKRRSGRCRGHAVGPDKTTVTLEPSRGGRLDYREWNANALFICLKLASAVAAGCRVVIKPSELSSLQTRRVLW